MPGHAGMWTVVDVADVVLSRHFTTENFQVNGSSCRRFSFYDFSRFKTAFNLSEAHTLHSWFINLFISLEKHLLRLTRSISNPPKLQAHFWCTLRRILLLSCAAGRAINSSFQFSVNKFFTFCFEPDAEGSAFITITFHFLIYLFVSYFNDISRYISCFPKFLTICHVSFALYNNVE